MLIVDVQNQNFAIVLMDRLPDAKPQEFTDQPREIIYKSKASEFSSQILLSLEDFALPHQTLRLSRSIVIPEEITGSSRDKQLPPSR